MRKLDRSDRRLRRLYLTDEAGTVVKRLRSVAMQLRRETLEGFSQAEHAALVTALKKIKTNLCKLNPDKKAETQDE